MFSASDSFLVNGVDILTEGDLTCMTFASFDDEDYNHFIQK